MKITISFFVILCLIVTSSSAQNRVAFNQSLKDSLANWVKIDQIAAQPKPSNGRFKNMSQQQWKAYQDSVFNTHQSLLKDVFYRYGFPDYNLVGKEGSNNYWLMVQHCDHYPDFQYKILKAMKKKVDKGNADSKNYAYLTDRVRINTGKKQLYGTQVIYNTDSCQAYPKPVEDTLLLDTRRKQIGLEPINEYLNGISEIHFMMNSAIYEKKGIHHAKLYPLLN